MQTLSSGSFITLENTEKIELLKNTAVELANSAVEAEDFIFEDKGNRDLSIELWTGLDYMCRDHEEAALRNIFAAHFLDRICEAKKALPALTLKEETKISKSLTREDSKESKDEFLGIVSNSDTNDERDGDLTAINAEMVSQSDSELPDLPKNPGTEENLEALELEKGGVSNSLDEIQNQEVIPELNTNQLDPITKSTHQTEVAQSNEPEDKKISETVFQLPEKEPYQIDKCTLNVSVQLLPVIEDSDKRKIVLSVRTHDFAPEFLIADIPKANLLEQLLPELRNLLNRYAQNLPVKVIDRMKKEKTAPKKQLQTVQESKNSAGKLAAKVANSSSDQQSAQQGSLFGNQG